MTKLNSKKINDADLNKVSGGTCAQLHELTDAFTSNNKILNFLAGASELASQIKLGCLGNIPLAYKMENILGQISIKSYISVGWGGSGTREVNNTYTYKFTGESLSHEEVLKRLKDYGKVRL